MELLFILFLYFDYCDYKENKYKYNYVNDPHLYIILIVCDSILLLAYKMNINNIYIKVTFGIWLLLRIISYLLGKVRLMERLFNEI